MAKQDDFQCIANSFKIELVKQGLPMTATLAELIAHHRTNAALAATFDAMTEFLKKHPLDFK